MKRITYIVALLIVNIQEFIWQYRIPVLTILGVIGFVVYFAGDNVRKKGITLAAQNQETDYPYKSVSLSLMIPGVALMLISAVMLYFAGGYDALFAKLGW